MPAFVFVFVFWSIDNIHFHNWEYKLCKLWTSKNPCVVIEQYKYDLVAYKLIPARASMK